MVAARVVILQLFVVLALAVNHLGLALPTLDSVKSMKSQEITGKQEGTSSALEQAMGELQASASNQSPIVLIHKPTAKSLPLQQASPATINKSHINNTEKLKRGLTNFMNHLNPAPFFVPQDAAKGSSAGSQAIVINEGGADAVIKGPNRLSRPLGSPLRWGR